MHKKTQEDTQYIHYSTVLGLDLILNLRKMMIHIDTVTSWVNVH